MYKKENKFGGRKKHTDRKFSSSRDRDEKASMHKAKCSECGKNCEVPFKPNGKKAIFCSHCFANQEGSQRDDNPGKRRINESGKETYSAICDSCGKSCGVPFKPNGKRPVLCSLCFAQNNNDEDRGERKEHKSKDRQLEIVNEKLDKILKILANLSK